MKKFLSVFVAFVMLFTVVPLGAITATAITFDQLNASNVFLKQEGSTTCTLCATTMMMRRYSMLRGDSGWSSITESTVKPTAWINGTGLRWSFSYSNSSVSNISVGHYTLPGGSTNEALIQAELKNCPEGIVIYNESVPHAVLLTDYSNGIYYCADPLGSVAKGRIPLTSAYKVRITNVTAYWKVTSPVVNGPTTHTHSYTGARLQEPDHPHVITQRCVDYATCRGYIVTGEYGQSKTCQQCWRVNWSVSTSSISVNVGQSKSINVSIDGIWPDTAKVFPDWDGSLFSYTFSQGVLTVTGLKKGTGKIKISIYSDANKSVLIGEKTISVTVSNPTYTGRVSFDKSSISLMMPDNKTSTLNIELTGTWPEGAGYTFDYNSNVVSMSQNGTVLTITAKNAGSTNFTINIVNKNNNNALITSAVCPITVKNATYTIKYNANGGNGAPSTQIKTYGTPIRISDVVPKREGFIFKGWTIWASSTTVKYLPGDEITANMDDGTTLTLYAVWEEITLKSIKVNSPDKVLYYMGEYLDTSGLRLRLEYSDGSTSVIDNGYSVSGFDSSFEGRKNVTVSYGGKTDSFEVMVISSSVSLSEKSITLNLGETKTISAMTDPVGCSVKWSVWNNNVVNVSNGKITAVGVGETKIEVTFEWQGYYSFATCDVTVNAVKTLSSISVESKPTKTTYEIGESLNTNGLKLKLKYSDGSTETITSGFTTSGFSSTTAGTKTVTVKYSGLTTTFSVTVKTAAQGVIDRIELLNVQSLEDKDIVVAVRVAYDALTDDQKALVTNLNELIAAEAVIAELEHLSEIKYGDIDGDKKITAADALEVLKSVVGKVILTESQVVATDVDGSGKADAADALLILKKVVGKIDKFPVEAAE